MASIHIDVSTAIKDLKKIHSRISGPKFDQAVVRAINHTIAKAKTSASKEIRNVYGAKSKDVKKALLLFRASRIDPSGSLVATGRPLPLMAFRARQNKRGVSVRIKGKSRLVHKAFIATMKSGHKGVFARGQYQDGKFKFRKRRVRKGPSDLPISELKTISVPTALSKDVILEHVQTGMERDFPIRLSHLLSRIK